jgi:glutamine amidotransferase
MSTPVGAETAGPTLRIAVIDYGAGNLHSLIKALEMPSTQVRVETDPRLAVLQSDALVLPGVGAFAPAAERLASGRDAIRTAVQGGLPLLGICLGMQLLYDSSDEGPGLGLGLFGGRVTRLTAQRVPQIGWNRLDDVTDPLLRDAELQEAYYANSFACRPDEAALGSVVAWSTHDGDRFPAAVRRGLVLGMQFHPEKSSAPGVRMLHAFCDAARARLLSLESLT